MKKLTTYFVLVLLICSICVVSASANVVDTDGTISDTKIYIAGMPIDISYTTYSSYEDTTYNGVAFDVTKYYYSPAHTPAWIEGTSSTDLIQWSHDTSGNSIYVDYLQDAKVTTLDSNQPIFVSSMAELDEWYNMRISIYDPHANTSVGASPQDAILVRHYYTVLMADHVDGEFRYRTYYFYRDIIYRRSGNYVEFFLYPQEIFNDPSFWEEYASFGESGREYAYILSSHAFISSPNAVISDDVWSTRIIFTPWSIADNQIYSTWNSHNVANEATFMSPDAINLEFNNVDFVTWIKTAVGGFMNFELVPGLTIAGILAIVLGIPLLIWFLRMFAGG